jgi:hypothetical protein
MLWNANATVDGSRERGGEERDDVFLGKKTILESGPHLLPSFFPLTVQMAAHVWSR